MKRVSVWVSEKLPSLFLSVRSNCSGTVKHLLLTHLSLNPSLFLFSILLSFSLPPQECCILFSASYLCFIFSVSLLPSLSAYLWGVLLPCLCLFCVHIIFVVPTSVESAADVGIIPYNTLVINHASGPSAKVQTQDLTQQVAYLGYKQTHVLE